MMIGFNDGVFHALFKNDTDRHKREFLEPLRDVRFKAMEIHTRNEKNMDALINDVRVGEYSNFDYITLHASDFFNISDEHSIVMLKKIELIVNKFNIYNVVIHPSNVSNWDVFNNFQHLPLSIENMDRSNKKGKTVEDIEYLINKYNFNLTLDLNHCLSNDESMELAREFHDRLGDRIVEYHISGYDKEKPHVPLYTVGQKEIIEALELKDKVIIIESEFNKIGEEIKEFEYIIDNLE